MCVIEQETEVDTTPRYMHGFGYHIFNLFGLLQNSLTTCNT